MPITKWQLGDRVLVAPTGERKRRPGWIRGTITAIDEPGLPAGVRVQLDRTVNGVDDCYATHSELRASNEAKTPTILGGMMVATIEINADVYHRIIKESIARRCSVSVIIASAMDCFEETPDV